MPDTKQNIKKLPAVENNPYQECRTNVASSVTRLGDF